MQLFSSRDELINMIINLRISNQQFLAQIHNTKISAMRSETGRDIMFSEVKTNRDLAAMVLKLKVKINCNATHHPKRGIPNRNVTLQKTHPPYFSFQFFW